MEDYTKGEYYEGLGTYLGIITVYPHNVDYKETRHKFAEHPPKDRRDCSKINEIPIERINREDR